jgi:hypothetical protein
LGLQVIIMAQSRPRPIIEASVAMAAAAPPSQQDRRLLSSSLGVLERRGYVS